VGKAKVIIKTAALRKKHMVSLYMYIFSTYFFNLIKAKGEPLERI